MLFAAYSSVAVLFVWHVVRRPHLLVRPSMWFCLAMLVQINAAAALAPIDEEVFFDQNVPFRLLAILFPFGVLLWLLLTPRLSSVAEQLAGRCRATDRPAWNLSVTERQFGVWLGAVSLVILLCYLREVPLSQSGLVAVLTRLDESALVREESLKLLDSWWLRYAYLFHMSVLGPFLAAMIFAWRPRAHALRWLRVPLILFVAVTVMLTGARAPAGSLLLGLAIVYLLRKGVRRGGLAVGLTACAALLIATVLTVFRQAETEVTSAEIYRDVLVDGVARRTFVTPFETGLWTNLYAEEFGLRGVRNIRPLAVVLGDDWEYLPNKVALEFRPYQLESSNANTCFLFDFQASFGLYAGWALSLVLLCLLDSVLYLFRNLSPGMLLISTGILLLRVDSLISSSYTTCLVSHGLIPVIGLAIACHWFFQQKTGSAPSWTCPRRTDSQPGAVTGRQRVRRLRSAPDGSICESST